MTSEWKKKAQRPTSRRYRVRIRKALLEMKSGEKALLEMKSDEKALLEMKSGEKLCEVAGTGVR